MQQLAQRGFEPDAPQLAAVSRLDRMVREFVAFKRARSNALKKLINRPAVPRGVWLWGGVGRGKSFLMDCFHAVVPVVRMSRVHFHEFMRSVHRELELLKGTTDPLQEVARRIARRYRLILFDEFHVSDIADAMILERLLRGLFAEGVTFVVTSNYPPAGLYPDGLHRDRVLPAIALLERHLDVVNVDAGVDYRLQTMAHVRVYLTPCDAQARAVLEDSFSRLAEAGDQSAVLEIEHRPIAAIRRAGGIIWFDFATLCGGPRSQNDYLEIATQFHTVLVSEVPRMDASMASEARRFTWLVDVLYDLRVKLLLCAACAPDQLYAGGAMAHEFGRTVSRLIEMQSRAYLEAPRRDAEFAR
ncbi:MAG: AFG1 family ATPase [Burkholderiales bacterium]|nr:MAG: AFG1 family ATPase [Burkholderiales bacterium]